MKLYAIYDMRNCYESVLGRAVLEKIFSTRDAAEAELKKISKPEYVSYSAVDFYFDGSKHGENSDITSFEEFVEFVKNVPGFVLITDNVGNSKERVVVYDKSKIMRKDPNGGYGCVYISECMHKGTRYEIREIEAED